MSKNYGDLATKEYKRLGGVLSLKPKVKLNSMASLSTYYTPGVADVSRLIAKNPLQLPRYSWTSNNVAVISDGSAVLGLGNIGPKAAMPVMEGKSAIFKNFADIDAIPIVLNVHTEDEIVAAIKAIASSFGGINLEDISAPLCFRVEDRLKSELNIPVFHDDQHGTAIVVLAGLLNACKVTGRDLNQTKIVMIGAGAAGTAVANLIHKYSPKAKIIMLDSRGIISPTRDDLNKEKADLLNFTNLSGISGNLEDALIGSDIFIGVSKGNLLNASLIKLMNHDPIIFALANPVPEILPNEAIKAGAAVVATGRSDFPNQVNNALVFPGVFRGALDHKVIKITDEHKISAAKAIANLIDKPTKDYIIPSALDKRVVKTVAKVIV